MDIRPIFSSLRRHKTAAALIVLEIALTCGIVCNAVYMIATRMDAINIVSGVADNELIRFRIDGIGTTDDARSVTETDLATLRALPGVKGVTTSNQIPFINNSWNSSIQMEPDQDRPTLSAAMYMTGDDFVKTTGLKIVSGRDFNSGEFLDFKQAFEGAAPKSMPAVIINKDMADKLYPGQDAVGKTFFLGKTPSTVVGVVEQLVRPQAELGGGPRGQYSMMLPIRMTYDDGGTYLIRADTAQRQQVMDAAAAQIVKNNDNRIVKEKQLLSDARRDTFSDERSMAWLLLAVIVALLIVTALGIVGLASFWVQQRTRMIGIRRALGATRGQILQYFQIENCCC